MIVKATFLIRIPEMSKQLHDLTWYKGNMDTFLGTVPFSAKKGAFSFLNTLKKLQYFSKLDFLIQLGSWIPI